MSVTRICSVLTVAALLLSWPASRAAAQAGVGELRVSVVDPLGAPVDTGLVVSSDATKTEQHVHTDAGGRVVIRDLPFGLYHVVVEAPGFAAFSGAVDITTAVPLPYAVKLSLPGVSAAVTVEASAPNTLLDVQSAGAVSYVGADLLRTQTSAPGRALVDVVNQQPGWLLEANGTLHPRGSEYQVQYVVDGIPRRDNRSPAFSRAFSPDEYDALAVRTAGFPAEYGGKLGGVIDVTTRRETEPGWHGAGGLDAGSFGTVDGHASATYLKNATGVGFGAETMRTDRYLDPPSLENDTNTGSGDGFTAHVDRQWREHDHTRISFERQRTSFLVPNEAFQQAAGQRQSRASTEWLVQAGHQHVASSRVVVDVGGMARTGRATLDSNALSTPIRASQDRGMRQGYVHGSVTAHFGMHELKAGAEVGVARIDEQFSSVITAYSAAGAALFDPDLPAQFSFSDRATQREAATYVQDLIHAGSVTASVGLRYDDWSLRAREHAWSPRLSIAWHIQPARIVVRGSYDRVFQTPALENILLATADPVERLGGAGQTLPLRSSRGNFYEAGGSALLGDRLRLDATVFLRDATNVADDDLLLNTAIAFPIAFTRARTHGIETKLDMPVWRGWSGFMSHSYSVGTGQLPIAGGLFLGNDVQTLLNSTGTFPLSQDQRHTVRARLQRQWDCWWLAGAFRYDSGLPVELPEDADPAQLTIQYGQRIVNRVDFEAGRVRSSASLDLSAGVTVWSQRERSLRLQGDVLNVTDRLNVINFAGLLSGTAVAAPRTWSLRVQVRF